MCVNKFYRQEVCVAASYSHCIVVCVHVQMMGEHHSCEEEIEALTRELNEYTLKVKTLKQKYNNSFIQNLQKDIQIRTLEQKVK